MWECQCDCGNTTVVSGSGLTQGHSKSCGCFRSEYLSSKMKIKKGEAELNRIYRGYAVSAKRRKRSFPISKEEFRLITKQNCYYCGCPPNNIKKAQGNNGDYVYTGIDRVDNFKGYTTKNTVPCCKDCNWAKKDKSLREFKNWVKLIYKNFIKNKE